MQRERFCPNTFYEGGYHTNGDAIGFGQGGTVRGGPHLRKQEQN